MNAGRASLRSATMLAVSVALVVTSVAGFTPATAAAASTADAAKASGRGAADLSSALAPALDCATVFSIQGAHPRELRSVDTGANIGTTTAVANFSSIGSGATTNLNALGITADGNQVFGALPANSGGTTRTIYRLDRAAETVTNVGAGVAGAATTHGAVNPANGFYYYGGLTGDTLNIYGFDTNSNTSIGLVASGTIPNGGTNGDWAFDSQGRLYVVAGIAEDNVISVVNQDIPTTAQATPVAITATELVTSDADAAINGVAFGGDGYLYIASSAVIYKINPSSGATAASGNLTQTGSVDLASCAVPSTIELRKNFPDGRLVATDQATLTITGGGLSSGNTGTTAGSDDGLQTEAAETAGPVLALSGTEYTISETGAGTGASYGKSWECVNQTSGASVASGTGTSGTFTMPASSGGQGISVVCTFTNAIPPQPDFGDAPNTYGTLEAASGARHDVPGYDDATDTAPLMLGTTVDVEADGVPGPDASGDDAAGIDDEDGLSGPLSLNVGTAPSVQVSVTNGSNQPATLAGWIDLNRDGTFEAAERATASVPANAGAVTRELTFAAPAVEGATYARFRLFPGEVADPQPTGAASAGEVEDYAATIDRGGPVVSCDTDPALFNTAYDGAGGELAPGATDLNWEAGLGDTTGPASVGSWIPAWVTNRPTAWALSRFGNADWISYYSNTSHSGSVDIYFRYRFRIAPEVSLESFSLPMNFYADNSVPEVWVNGVAQSQFHTGSLPQSTNTYFYEGYVESRRAKLVLNHSFQHGPNTVIVRVGSAGPNQGFMAQVGPSPLCADTGDAPASYGTTKADNGAAHGLAGYDADAHTADLMLGDTIDADVDGQPSTAADGDDTAAADDEDGLADDPTFEAGSTTASLDVDVTVATGSGATLHGWIDADLDGVFEPSEHASTPVSAGVTSAALNWTGLSAMSTGAAPYVRLRLTSATLNDSAGTTFDDRARGAAPDGEVEDYRAVVGSTIPAGCASPFVEDFGTGPNYGGPLPAGQTTYVWRSGGTVNDGSYTLVSALAPASAGAGGIGGWWHTGSDRTDGDTDGRMMLVNATAGQTDQFFQRTFRGLQPGATYDFSAWVTNAGTSGSIQPNVKFRVVDARTGAVITEVDSGNLPYTTAAQGMVWKRVALQFDTSARAVRLEIQNNAPGGSGNDLALDDISFNLACEFGDAPASYGTLASDSGPVHELTGPRIGATRDGEGDGLPSTDADGDDTADTDDEDGVAFNPDLGYPNPTIRTGPDPITLEPVSNTLEVTASDDGFVSAWVDWNIDGDFNDAGERVANAQPVTAGANDITFSRSENPPDIRTYVRVRYSTDAASIAQPTGPAPDGEVEDYRVLLERLITPAACSPVSDPYYAMTFLSIEPQDGGTNTQNSARYPNVTVVKGEPVDMLVQRTGGNSLNSPGFRQGGDDAAWNINAGGAMAQITYTFVQSGTTTPIAVNGIWTVNDMDSGETAQIQKAAVAGYAVTPGSKVVITEEPSFIRFTGTVSGNGAPESRWQMWFQNQSTFYGRWDGFALSGYSLDGDNDIPVLKSCDDYGDAPDSYKTLLASDGPHHTVTPQLRLGADTEFDGDGQPGASANGDDANRNDDEDGVAAQIRMTGGEPTTVQVAATNDTTDLATLAGWLDLDGDGTFELGERVVVPVPASSGSATYSLVFPPGTGTPASAFARFRLFPGALTDPRPTGAATAGEVEDYPVEVLDRELEITKSSDATADSRPGDTITYTVTAENIGTGDFTADNPARVVDDLSGVLDDADFNDDAAADLGDDPTYGAPRLLWTGALPAGETVTITYTVTLKGGGDGDVDNVAWGPAIGDPPGPTPDCDDPSTTVPCAEEQFDLPKLTIVKRSNRTDLPADGEQLIFTVTVTNEGPGVYTAGAPATFTDDLSEVLDDADFDAGSITASAGSASFDPATGELTWTGPLAADASATIGYSVTYDEDKAGGDQQLDNAACVPEDEALNAGQACITVRVPGSGLEQSKRSNPASGTSVDVGDEITYTLTFTNTGPAAASVNTTDDLSGVLDDAELVSGPTADTGLTVTPGAGDTFAITGTVPVDDALTVTYRVRVKDFGAQGDHTLGNVLACQPGDPADCVPETTEHEVRRLRIEKTSDATVDSRPGDVVTYTVAVENIGTGDYTAAQPAALVDDLSGVLDDADYQNDAISDVGDTPTYAAPRVRWSGPLAAGQTATITYTVVLAGGGDGQVDNVAWAPDPGDPPGPTPDCEDPGTTVPCDGEQFDLPKLSITKTADPTEVHAVGDVVTYTVVVKSEGPGDYTASDPASFSDDLSDVLDDATYVAGSESADVGTASYADPTLSWSGALAAGDEATISYQVRYTGTGDQSLRNAACVPRVEALEQSAGCDEVTVDGPLLVQSKTSNPDDGTIVGVGDEISYTLTFANDGKAPAAVDTTDDLSNVLDDAELVAGPTALPGLTADRVGDLVEITGSVPAGETRTVTYTVRVTAPDTGDGALTNVLACQPGEPPTCDPETTEHPVRDLEITKVSSATGATRQGDTVTYTVTAENIGGGDYTAAEPARVVDDLTAVLDDAGFNDDASADVGDDPTYDEPRLTWSGALAAGEIVTITYTVTLKAGGDGVLRNVAWAPDPGDPPGPTPDCDDPDTTVPCDGERYDVPHLSVSKSASHTDLPALGETMTYTVVVTNEGPGDYTVGAPATFTDDLSDVLDDATFVSGSATADVGTASFNDPSLSWSGVLASGEDATITYQVQYNGDGDHRLDNSACVPAAEAADPDEPCDVVRVPGSDLSWTKSSDPADGASVDVGDEIIYTLTFTNDGEAAGTVDTTDDLSGVLDDAALVDGPTAQPGLTADRVGDVLEINGSVPARTSRTVTYTVEVLPFGEQGDHRLRNALACNVGAVSSCEPEVTEHPVRHLSVTKTSGTRAVDTGDRVTYVVQVHNDGAGDYTDADPASVVDDLSDVIDDALIDVDDVEVSGGSVEYDAPELTWTGALPTGATVVINYTVLVTNQGDHELVNTVSAVGCPAGDPACAPPPTTTPLPHVVPAKTADPAAGTNLAAGDLVTYTLRWTNDGEADGSVDATDDLSGVLDDAELVAGPTSSSPAVDATLTGDQLRVVGPIAAGDSVTVVYQVRVLADADRDDDRLENVLTPDTPQVECSNESCEPVEPPTTVHLVGALDDWKTADPRRRKVQAGDRVTYTLHFANSGAAPVDVSRDDVMTRVLDDAVLVSRPRASDPALTVSRVVAGRFTVTGVLAPDQTVTVSYTVRVKPRAKQGDRNLANFLVDEGQRPPRGCQVAGSRRAAGEPTDCTSHQVRRYDLSVDKRTVTRGPVGVGDAVKYRIVVSNKGPDASSGRIEVVDELPRGLDLRSARGKGWECSIREDANTATCVRTKALAPGRAAPRIVVVATVRASAAGGRVVNTAEVNGVSDSNANNNDDAAVLRVAAIPPLPGTGFRHALRFGQM